MRDRSTDAHLIRGTEDVRVVLNEPPYTRQTAQRSACLVSVENTEFGEPEGKLPVTALPAVEYEAVTWAVHGFESEFLLFDVETEHVLRVVLPVAGGLP